MYYSLSDETLDELERLFITMAGIYLNHEKRMRYGRERTDTAEMQEAQK